MKNTLKIFLSATIILHFVCIPAHAKTGDIDKTVYPIPRDAAVDKFIYMFSENNRCTSENLAKYKTQKSECKSRLKIAKKICPSLVIGNDTNYIADEKELNLISSGVGTCIIVTLHGRKYSNEASDKIWNPSDG